MEKITDFIFKELKLLPGKVLYLMMFFDVSKLGVSVPDLFNLFC